MSLLLFAHTVIEIHRCILTLVVEFQYLKYEKDSIKIPRLQ